MSLTTKIKALKLYGKALALAKNQNLGPTLAEMLAFVNHDPGAFNLDPSGKIAVEALVSRQVKQSKFQLDRIMHNPSVITHSDEVVSIREQAMPLLLELLK